MSSQDLEPVQLDDVLSSCSVQAVATQQKLDATYLAATDAFEDFLAWALGAGLAEFARQFEPQQLVVQEQELQFQIATTAGTFQDVRILNQVFAQRYRTGTAIHSITLRVLRSAPQISV